MVKSRTQTSNSNINTNKSANKAAAKEIIPPQKAKTHTDIYLHNKQHMDIIIFFILIFEKVFFPSSFFFFVSISVLFQEMTGR